MCSSARASTGFEPASGSTPRTTSTSRTSCWSSRGARKEGLKLLVDFHYSDFWADPGKQWTPEAWVGKTFPELKQTFVEYTRDVLASLVRQKTPADMVQLGNEINPGMLWDYAATWTG